MSGLQYLLHADAVGGQSHTLIEGLGLGIAGPNIEGHVVAAEFAGEIEHLMIQRGAHMMTTRALINA